MAKRLDLVQRRLVALVTRLLQDNSLEGAPFNGAKRPCVTGDPQLPSVRQFCDSRAVHHFAAITSDSAA